MKRWLLLAGVFLAPTPLANAQEEHGGHHEHHGHSMHQGPVMAPAREGASPPVPPSDHAADAIFDPAAMARARRALRREAGGMTASMLMFDRLEWRPVRGDDGYAWEVEGWTGGDLDRLAIKSKGEGALGGGPVEKAEFQVGWSHAIDPWFNLRTGVRQDFQPRPRRTQAVLAIEGLAPYWFEVEGELFLSHKGEVTARVEASYDQRLTQRLILQPAAELNISAQAMSDLHQSAGFTSAELGLRLRYEITREFVPYVGLHWERRFGRTADHARAEGEKPGNLHFVTGVRLWF